MREVHVIGSPVGHSLSPVIHNAAYQHLGLDYAFSVKEVLPEELPEFIQNLPTDIAGLAVTAPLKHAICNLLDAVEPMATTLGVVNTVVVSGPLKTGLNTDVYGIKTSLLEAPSDLTQTPHAKAAIIGAGSTAVSALMACAELGVKDISLVARSFHKPPSAVKVAHTLGITPHIVPLSHPKLVEAALSEAHVIVSTIPGQNLFELNGSWAKNQHQPVLLEADYANAHPATAESITQLGGTYIPGTRMLLHQATAQFQLITGVTVPTEVMERALNQALAERN